MPGERPQDELPALFQMIEDLRADGTDEAEIVAFVRALDEQEWQRADGELAEQGVSEEDRAHFWNAFNEWGDTEPDDMIDESDGDYVPGEDQLPPVPEDEPPAEPVYVPPVSEDTPAWPTPEDEFNDDDEFPSGAI